MGSAIVQGPECQKSKKMGSAFACFSEATKAMEEHSLSRFKNEGLKEPQVGAVNRKRTPPEDKQRTKDPGER